MRQRGQTTTFQMRLEIGEYAAAGVESQKVVSIKNP